MICALALIALTLPAAGPQPRVAVVVTATGFAEGDAARLEQKAGDEIAGRGFEVVRLRDADTACLATRACARDLVGNAAAAALVRVDLIRGGGNVQLTASVTDAEGRRGEDATAIARLTSVLGDEALLPAAIGAALTAVAASEPAAAPPAPSTDPPPAVAPPPPTTAEPLAPQAPPVAEPPPAEPLSGLALGAIAGIAVGALAATVGLVGATGQYTVARDPGAPGGDKERAAVLVPTLVVVGVAGVALAGASGWLLAGELD